MNDVVELIAYRRGFTMPTRASTANSSLQSTGIPTAWIVEQDEGCRNRVHAIVSSSTRVRCERALSSCDEALQCCLAEAPPDLFLISLDLPCMKAFEGMKKLKQHSPGTQVLVLAVDEEDEHVFKAILAGATGYILKHDSDEKIVSAVEEIVGGGAPMEPHVARKVLTAFARGITPAADYILTSREREILLLIADGLTKKEIGDKLFVSYFTVDTHIKNIYYKMHVHTRGEAVSRAYKNHVL
jgi:DNA-binding NarL/FixJ family response regulator